MIPARPLAPGETFAFRCHPGVPCFNACCRDLELALTPYDVLQLAQGIGVPPSDFLNRYAVIEADDTTCFPRVYLGMVDDGQASCPFVSPAGCQVYAHRPGACRTYPMGRGASLGAPGAPPMVQHILVTESHCHGFGEGSPVTADDWAKDQGLAPYQAAADLLLPLLQHARVRQGFRPTARQRDLFIAALYTPDLCRPPGPPLHLAPPHDLVAAAVGWLIQEFFGHAGR